MKRGLKFLVLFFLLNNTVALGAMPPLYQSTNDLDAISDILRGFNKSSLYVLSVDLITYSATLKSGDKTCKVFFQRKKENRPPGWVGPATSLEIKSNNCN